MHGDRLFFQNEEGTRSSVLLDSFVFWLFPHFSLTIDKTCPLLPSFFYLSYKINHRLALAMPLESKAYQKPGPEDGPVLTRFGLLLIHSTFCIRLADVELCLFRWTYHSLQRKLPARLPPSFSPRHFLEINPFGAQGWICPIGQSCSSQEIHPLYKSAYPWSPDQAGMLPQLWDWTQTKKP